jgi:GNAT superfamily N-acetyltransferase
MVRRVAECIPGSEIVAEPGFLRVKTGVPSPIFNGVFETILSENAARQRAEEGFAYFEHAGVPMEWAVTSESEPANLADILQQAGFVFGTQVPGMVLTNLQTLAPIAPHPTLCIELVEHESQLAPLRVVVEAFRMASAVNEAYIRVCARLLGNREVQHFIGFSADVPVCCGCVLIDGEVAGLYTIATVVEARGQGFGAAISAHLLQQAQQRGCHTAVLTASKLGYSVYERLGFKETGHITYYTVPAI